MSPDSDKTASDKLGAIQYVGILLYSMENCGTDRLVIEDNNYWAIHDKSQCTGVT